LKSLLRYPGGKTRALKHIAPYFPKDLTEMVSPFFGGGSIEIHYATTEGVRVHGYEIFEPLVNFWQQALTPDSEKKKRVSDLLETTYHPCTKEDFATHQTRQSWTHWDDTKFMWKEMRACMFYALNRSSFSGCTMSAGFSKQAADNRFTESSIERFKDFICPSLSVDLMDFKDSLAKHDSDTFIYADPPYAIDNPVLYGENGSTHRGFDHLGLAEVMKEKNNWVISYNSSPFILELYKDYQIVPLEWSYGMKNVYSTEVVAIRNMIKDIQSTLGRLSGEDTFEKDQEIINSISGLLDTALRANTKEMGKSDEILILNVKKEKTNE